MLRLANKRAIALELLYGTSRVQRMHARGHLVAGATAATSSCGGELRARWLVQLELEIEHGSRGKRFRGSQ